MNVTPPTRRSGMLFCPACQRWRPEGRMLEQVSRTERQQLTECKDCQLSASRAGGIIRAERRKL